MAVLALSLAFIVGPVDAAERPARDLVCLTDCREAFQADKEIVAEGLKLCLQTECLDERQNARAVCRQEPDSEACNAAVAAVRACVEGCREEAQPGFAACRAAHQACVRACPVVAPPR
jgi:hypothetical protein